MIKEKIPVRSYTGEFRKTNPSNKKYLSIDFNHRCAYCDDLDSISGGYDAYHVEHFAPKEKFPKLIYVYENLLYSCPYCNGSKNADWPSDDFSINIVGDIGYVDPCTTDYYNHLDRDERTGNIYAKTELGNYMFKKMKLYLLRHPLIYMIDKLKQKREQLKSNIDKEKALGKDVNEKEEALKAINDSFFEYYDKLLFEQST